MNKNSLIITAIASLLLAGCNSPVIEIVPLNDVTDVRHDSHSCPNLNGTFWSGISTEALSITTSSSPKGTDLYAERFYNINGKLHSYTGSQDASTYKGICKDDTVEIEYYHGKTLQASRSYKIKDGVLTVYDSIEKQYASTSWLLAPSHNLSECPILDGTYLDPETNSSLKLSLYTDDDLSSGFRIEEEDYFYSLRLKGQPFEVEFGNAPFETYTASCNDKKIIIDSHSKNGSKRRVFSLYQGNLLVEETENTITKSRLFSTLE